MSAKYEIIEIDHVEITVDVSMLIKSDDMFFNATQIAKYFGKQPSDFLRLASSQEYINEVLRELRSGNYRNENVPYESLVRVGFQHPPVDGQVQRMLDQLDIVIAGCSRQMDNTTQ